jgi:hypothetical protein
VRWAKGEAASQKRKRRIQRMVSRVMGMKIGMGLRGIRLLVMILGDAFSGAGYHGYSTSIQRLT